MISSSRLAELQRAPPAWKFCAVQSQERFDRENAQRADQANMNGRRFFDCGSGKPRRGHEKHCLAARIKTSARGRNRAVATRKDREEAEVLLGLRGYSSCICDPRRLSSCLAADGGRPRVGQQVGLRAPQKVTNAPINPNLDSSSKTDLETCRKYRELTRKLSERALTQRKARAREEPSPGPPASETDARPPGHQPRGGASARPRLSRGQEGPT